MSLLVTLNGANYIIPETNEVGWGSNLDDYFVAIPAGVLQKTGGSFTLSAEIDFGSSYGLKSLYYKSRSSNIAASGIIRLNNNSDAISWRNFLGNGDLALTVNASNQLCFNGTPIESNALTSGHILVGNVSDVATDVPMTGDIGITNTGLTSISSGVIVNGDVNASAGIVYTKLALTDSIINNDINSAAAISYSKLNLTGGIINTDVSASAAIVYSKLSLGNSILNADINSAAGIVYSKLSLSNSILNADINSAAGIVITKIAPGTANQIIGANAGATANEYKTLTSTSNQVTVTQGVGSVTFSTPQDIATSSAVRFGSLTLGGTLDTSSILSLISTTKGFLPPVMTTTQRNAISSPTDGLVVFDSSLAQLFLRASSAWTPLSVGGGSGTVASGTQYQLGYYAANGTTISGNSGLLTNASNQLGIRSAITTGYDLTVNGAAQLGNGGGSGTAITQLSMGFGTGTNAYNANIKTHHSATPSLNLVEFWVPTSSSAEIKALTLNGSGSAIFSGTALFPSTTTFQDTITITKAQTNNLSIDMTNTNAASTSSTRVTLTVDSAAGGDAFIQQSISGGSGYSFGIDNSDSDKFKLTTGSSPSGGTELLVITSAGAATLNGNFAFTSPNTQGIVGTTSNSAGAAGNVGEVIEATITPTGSNYAASGNYSDLTSITLSAGDWLVSGISFPQAVGSSTTYVGLGISTTTGNSSSGLVNGTNFVESTLTTTKSISLAIPSYHMQVSGSTIVYLKIVALYSGTTPAACGRITAVRIR